MRMHRSAAAPAIKANSHLAHIIAITACTYSRSQLVEELGRANWSPTMTNGQRIRGRYDKPNKESTRWLSVSLFRLNMRKKSGMTVIFHSNIPLAHANTTSVVVIMNKRTYVFRKNTYQKCPLTYGPFSGQKYHPEKSRITNSIFWAILDIEGFPFFLEDVWGSWAPSGPACGLGRNLYPK